MKPSERHLALSLHLKLCPIEIEESPWASNGFITEDKEKYLCLLDWEADDYADNYLIDYFDELDILNWIKPYFNAVAWKNDMLSNGRGEWISHYDGVEEETQFNGEWYYIYRVG